MALGRLHPSDEYDIRIAVEEGEGGSLDGKWIAMLVDEIEHYSGENERLTALLAERDAEIARLKLTTRSDREYAEQKQRAEEAEGENARLVERVAELEAVVRDVVTAWDSDTDMSVPAAVDKCDAALAARGGEVQG